MKFLVVILNFFGLIFISWLAGFIWFIGQIPGEADNLTDHTDAIIVLTGGSGRVDAGISLLAKGTAKKLFISGVGKNASIDDIGKASKYSNLATLEDNITLGYEADNTVGNATETKSWMQANKFNSLTLVTSNYHIPRSLAEFRAIMPEYKINPYPVCSSAVKLDKWWAFPGTMKLIITEYNKFILNKLK